MTSLADNIDVILFARITINIPPRTIVRKQVFMQCQETGVKIYAESILRAHSRGVMPVMLAKVREKTAGEEKPHRADIS